MKQQNSELVDQKSSHVKNILHGFFLSIGTTVAEPSTILPLIIHYFSGSSLLVGIFASLLKGGAIFVQMVAAFYAQSYQYMMPYLRLVFLVRFLSWFGIGLIIAIYGESSSTITLWGIGILLFTFSFSAGFGAIYFKEILGKVFSNSFRGKSMAYRQFFSGLGAIISGTTAGIFLQHFDPPYSFAYLFMASAIIMGFGLFAFATIGEPKKEKIKEREGSFFQFLKDSFVYFQGSIELKNSVLSYLFSYGHLIALPFIILDAGEHLELSGYLIGIFLSVQMTGGMLSNILWGKISSAGEDKKIIILSFGMFILSIVLAIFFHNVYIYGLIFFLIGASIDGTRLAFGNLILIIAPEEKRPIYIALQANISSIGLFFPILGGAILSFSSYLVVYIVSIAFLLLGLYYLNRD
jgi:MFS family permease